MLELLALLTLTLIGLDDPGPLPGYSNDQKLAERVNKLAESEAVRVTSLAKTLEGRDLWLLELGYDEAKSKPALLIVGDVEPHRLVGSEIALKMAEDIIQNRDDPRADYLLRNRTVYIIPRPNPDGTQAFFQKPYRERHGNARPTDDDRDGETGEDGPLDLNHDGWVTWMRIEDPAGDYRVHPDDPRVMQKVDRSKGEVGTHFVYREGGYDQDEDGLIVEDGSLGVAFNRNFAFRYPYFGVGAGPHQVSEIETRAVADFMFDHPNIVAVLSFSPEDNLMHPWKADPAAAKAEIKEGLLPDDAPYFDAIAKEYRDILGRDDCPPSPKGAGSFSEWAYFHYGRWSFAARGWWIPTEEPSKVKDAPDAAHGEKTAAKNASTNEPRASQTSPEKPQAPEPEPSAASDAKEVTEKETADKDKEKDAEKGPTKTSDPDADRLVKELRYCDQNQRDAFVPWQRGEMPNHPELRVEVGGIKPFVLDNPPISEIPGLADKHLTFAHALAQKFPAIKVERKEVESVRRSFGRVTLVIRNVGALPFMSKMGQVNNIPPTLRLEWKSSDDKLPIGFVTGHARVTLNQLGAGQKHEFEWLIGVTESYQMNAQMKFQPKPKPPLSILLHSPTILPRTERIAVP